MSIKSSLIVKLVLILTLLGWTLSFSARADDPLYEAAKKEGVVHWYSQFDKEVNEEIVRAFEKKYPGIRVDHLRKNTPDQLATIAAERMAKRVRADVLNNTDPAVFEVWKREGFLDRYVPKNAGGLAPEFRDKDGFFHVMGIYAMIGVYNTKQVRAEEAPQSWTDFLNPKWKGKTVSSSPRLSGVELPQFANIVQRHGWEFVGKLAKNDHIIIRGQGTVLRLVTSGERLAALGVSAYRVFDSVEKGDPIKPIFYQDGITVINVNVGITKESAHKNAAKLLVEFLLSPEGQAIVTSEGAWSSFPNVKPPKGAPALSSLKLIQADTDFLIRNRDEITNRFDAIFGLK